MNKRANEPRLRLQLPQKKKKKNPSDVRTDKFSRRFFLAPSTLSSQPSKPTFFDEKNWIFDGLIIEICRQSNRRRKQKENGAMPLVEAGGRNRCDLSAGLKTTGNPRQALQLVHHFSYCSMTTTRFNLWYFSIFHLSPFSISLSINSNDQLAVQWPDS